MRAIAVVILAALQLPAAATAQTPAETSGGVTRAVEGGITVIRPKRTAPPDPGEPLPRGQNGGASWAVPEDVTVGGVARAQQADVGDATSGEGAAGVPMPSLAPAATPTISGGAR